jgi:hypothetical protein
MNRKHSSGHPCSDRSQGPDGIEGKREDGRVNQKLALFLPPQYVADQAQQLLAINNIKI